MFVSNFDKLKTNSALKAVYHVKHHLKWLKINCWFPELQGLSFRNNMVTACCSTAGRTAGVCPTFASIAQRSCSAGQVRCPLLPGALNGHPCDTKRIWRWYNVVLARPMCFWRSSGEYIYAFICVQYFENTLHPLSITPRTKICAALVQRPPPTSNECWRTTDARETILQNYQVFVGGSCVDYVRLSLTVKNKQKCWHWARI